MGDIYFQRKFFLMVEHLERAALKVSFTGGSGPFQPVLENRHIPGLFQCLEAGGGRSDW